MNSEKYLIEQDLQQTEREIGVFFKAGVGLVVLDTLLMLTNIAKPGRWFYEFVGNWVYPVVIGIGGFALLFAVYLSYKLTRYYMEAPEYRERIKPTLFKSLVYVFGFVVFFLFMVVSDIQTPEFYSSTDWI